MNKRHTQHKKKADPNLSTMNAFYFYQVEELEKLKRLYPMMTQLEMDRIIVQSWFLLSEQEKLKYELIRESCVTAYLQEEAEYYCKKFEVPYENLKDIYIKERDRLSQMYIPLQYSKEEYADKNQGVQNKMIAVNQEQFQQTSDTVEVLERVLNLKMNPQSQHNQPRQNAKPLNFQINFCASSREIMQNAHFIKDLIIEQIPDSDVEIYPIGGRSGDIIIYRIREGQNTPIWSCLVDGLISQDGSQAFIRVLKQIQGYDN